MVEIWRPVRGFEGLYKVSNKGRVRSSRGVLRECTLKRGSYRAVSLWRNNKGHTRTVHRLVLLAFRGEPQDGQEANHLDGDKGNNCLSNLEWVTRSENIRHAIDNGLMPRLGEGNPSAKIDAKTVLRIRRLAERGARNVDICEAFGLGSSHVSNIVSRKLWSHV